MTDKGDVDILALEQLVRTPFRSGGIKVIGEDGKPEFLPGPERIPRTRGRMEIYLNNKNIGDMGAKLIGNELKNNTDCISLWIYGNGITTEGAAEIAKGLKVRFPSADGTFQQRLGLIQRTFLLHKCLCIYILHTYDIWVPYQVVFVLSVQHNARSARLAR